MALTKIITDGITDDAVTEAKLANAINTAVAANTAKDLTALSASNLTSGTIPDARFPATLPAASATNLTAVPAANITGTLPAISAANLTSIPAANITGTLPAISATNLTNIPAANITGTLPAISGANLTNLPASGKANNLIINGAMQVAQRGTSSTTSGMKTVDRFTCNWSGGGVTQAQISEQSGTVFENGFSNYLRLTNTSNTTTDTDYRFIGQTIEAQNIANSGWNFKSTSSYVTFSFWVRSSLAGTYYGWLNSRDGTGKTNTFSFTLSANTWTKVTKTISGNSGIDIHNNNEEGLLVHVIPWYGTYYTTSGHTLDAWQTSDSTNRTPDYAQNWANTSNATFDLTGVQLEVGDSGTDFAHESFEETLRRCQRYFQVLVNEESKYFGGGYMYDHYRAYLPVQYYVEMRSAPSFQFTSGTNYWSLHRNGTGDNFDGWNTAIGGDNKHTAIQAQSGLSGTGGHAGAFWSGNANSKITFESEI